MNNQIVRALTKFKIDVYANMTSKDAMKQYLINTLGLQVWSGQKRLVVFDSNNPNIVYKIAYSEQGILDNINEVAVSNKLMALAQVNEISNDDLSLFGLAKLVNGDPFIVSMNSATNYIQDPDFIRWYNINRKPDFNENQLFALYIKEDQQLMTDYNRIQTILSTWFIPSDVTIFKEPKNYCLTKNSSGRKRLVLIDLGSVCPKLVYNNRPIVPTCEKCQTHEKIYVPYHITPQLELNSSLNIEGLYLCTNSRCIDYVGTVATSKTPDATSKDSYVFSKYLLDNRGLVKRLRAIDGLYYIPNKIVVNKNQYLQEMRTELRITPPPAEFDCLFRNYCSYACGVFYSMMRDIVQGIPAVDNQGRLVPFTSYLNMFNGTIGKSGFNINAITNRIAALVYVSILSSRDNDLVIFDVLTQPDINQFAVTINSKFGVDQHNGMALYNAIHINN